MIVSILAKCNDRRIATFDNAIALCNNSVENFVHKEAADLDSVPWFIQAQSFYGMSSLFYVERRSLPKRFPLHRHDFIEIELIVSGEGREIINGIEYNMKAGSISLLLPWHSHEIIPQDKKPLDILKCSFATEFFGSSNAFFELSDIVFNSLSLSPVTDLGADEFETVSRLFMELLSEYTELNLWRDSLLKGKISEILIRFDRCRRKTLQEKMGDAGKTDIWKIITFVHSSFNKNITSADVAEKFHYSISELDKKLAENTGLGFEGLLEEVRVRNACTMLAYPMIPINEVANQVGFSSRGMFYKAFRNVKGTSPENYRKSYLSNSNYASKSTIINVLNAQIIYYLHLHFSEDISLSTLSKEFHYNETYLSNTLMQNGVNFVRLLHEIRIYHACSMLLTTDLPVNEIGFRVGFDSLETFYRVFKELKSITPREYRKNHAEFSDHL